jgi:hypothetical protein
MEFRHIKLPQISNIITFKNNIITNKKHILLKILIKSSP